MKSYVVTVLAVVLLACLFQETDSEPRLWGRWKRRRYCKKVDCAFGSWNRWGSCSRSCGPYGIQSRERSYLRQASCGGKHCYGSLKETRSCNQVCLHEGILKFRRCYCKPGYSGQCCQSVTGAWSSWGRWSSCSKTCGYGHQTSRRQCSNPSTKYGKKACPGSDIKTRSCHKKSCAVDGGWSSWGKWESCSKSCGTGTRKRSRDCTHPRPGYGGKRCYGPSEQTQSCNTKKCPVNGRWSRWGKWSTCSKSCGYGKQTSRRYCTNPPPRYGGKSCRGSSIKSRSCRVKTCPVNGRWSSWGKWCACSKKCGGGTQYRTRSCTNPPPDYGGKDCLGNSKQTKKCSKQPCPVNGGWSTWGKWGRCSKTCGDGTQKRRRYCTNPRPRYGGKSCSGSGIDVQTCHLRPCKVNGRWSLWGDWSECSKTCGSGSKIRRRSCTNPPPQHGGKTCKGTDEQTKLCVQKDCPVDGGWSPWGKWCACSKSCGAGTQYRTRSCTNPHPDYGGKDCPGTNKDTRQCNTEPCSVNGRWSLWGDWSECTKTCGSGSKTRRRSCTNPPPQHGGKTCKGIDEQTKLCNVIDCSDEDCWKDWSDWSPCDKMCDCGLTQRVRYCRCGYGHRHPKCQGPGEESMDCNCDPCPNGPPNYDAVKDD